MTVINAKSVFKKDEELSKVSNFSEYVTQGQFEIINYIINDYLKSNLSNDVLSNLEKTEYQNNDKVLKKCAIINIDLKKHGEAIISFNDGIKVLEKKEQNTNFYFEISDHNDNIICEYNIYDTHAINLKNKKIEFLVNLNVDNGIVVSKQQKKSTLKIK